MVVDSGTERTTNPGDPYISKATEFLTPYERVVEDIAQDYLDCHDGTNRHEYRHHCILFGKAESFI